MNKPIDLACLRRLERYRRALLREGWTEPAATEAAELAIQHGIEIDDSHMNCQCVQCQRRRIADAQVKAGMMEADAFIRRNNLLRFPIEQTKYRGQL